MTELDQLKALGDANSAARSGSTAKGGASQAANTALPHTVHERLNADIVGRKAANGERPAAEPSGPTNSKRPRGRPKIEGPRPWELEGVPKRTWYRRKAEKK